MRLPSRKFLVSASLLVLCGLLSGVILAAAAFPAAALSGLAAKAGNESFEELPSELKAASAPQYSRLLAADGKTEITKFYDEFRREVSAKDVPKVMLDAIVAAEDHNFYKHHGVDLKGVVRAAVSNSGGNDQQGASTLTMQYVRMTLTYSSTTWQGVVDATAKTNKRKINEIKYAMELEKRMSKQDILVGYLNTAPFGNGAYGVYAASQIYFGKQPKQLTVAEAAQLAGIVRGTSYYDPTTAKGAKLLKDRRDWVVKNMRELDMITDAQQAEAVKVKVSTKVKQAGNGCTAVRTNSWGFFCDFFVRWWNEQKAFGKTTYDRQQALKGGGYTIVSSMDVKATAAARANIAGKLSTSRADALVVAAVEPRTGKVKALATNRKYKLDDGTNKPSPDPAKKAAGARGSFPNTTNPLITGGGDIVGYQAGSVFKMFTMVAALEKGYPLAYPINTEYRYKSPTYLDSGAPAECGGHYCPVNAGKSEKGPYNMWTGFGSSVNTYFVPLEEQVGADKVVNVAQRFGVKFRAPDDQERATKYAKEWGAFTLGVSASTPLDIANAYATLAADGMYCSPIPVQSITSLDGKKVAAGKPQCKRATSADVARAAIDAARCPVGDQAQLGSCGGHTTASGARGGVGYPIFGKTGTTDGDKTASLVLSTAQMAVAGYLVNPDYPNHPYRMDHDVVNPVVIDTLHDIMKGKKRTQFKTPGDDEIAKGEQVSIPGVKCVSVDEATSRLEDAGFSATTAGTPVPSDCPAGQAAGTVPSGTTIKGGFVSIQVSAGPASAPSAPPSGPPGR
ncbi:transglycosylase domain-containing protein [Actinoplanes sp. RD1]|uniref:transglycosylase domain-containing protein n=1 Tax=Actinoplanes sp. RD1 TaxID=3064538 RepID=UPI002742522C|nr:transglycosylase domain-containing protein [Actinoplanes sp. RD1]